MLAGKRTYGRGGRFRTRSGKERVQGGFGRLAHYRTWTSGAKRTARFVPFPSFRNAGLA